MRLCPGVFIITILSCIGILVFVCSIRARDKGTAFRRVETLATELTNLQLQIKANVRQLEIAQGQLKDAENTFEDCQKNNKQALREIELGHDSAKRYQQRADELEQMIQKHDSKIQAVQLSIKSMKTETPSCKPTWSTEVDTNSVGGILHEFSQTLSDCLGYCFSLPACIAVDFNKEDLPSKRCWYHTSPIELGPKDTFSQIGTTQYRLKRTCNTDQVGTNGNENRKNFQESQQILEKKEQSQQVLYNVPPVVSENFNQNSFEVAQRQNLQGVGDEGGKSVHGQQADSSVVQKGWYAPIVHQNAQAVQGSNNYNQNGLEVAQRQNVLGIGDEGGKFGLGQQSGNSAVRKGWYAPIVHQNVQVDQGSVQQNIPRMN